VVRQLFEAELIDPERRAALLADAAAPAAGLFEPLAGEEVGESAPQGTFAILHGLLWLTLNLAGGEPLALIVDDLHWSDRPSLRFCSYLAHRLDSTPVSLIVGLRDTEAGTDPELIAAIGAEPETLTLRPGALSDEAVSAIVTERLGGEQDAEFDDACARATGGNPLLLRQLLRAVESEGGGGAGGADLIRSVGGRAVSRSVRLRLDRLGEEAKAVANAVAILGEGTDVASVAELTGLDRETVAALTGALTRAEILRPDLPLGFVHPLVLHAVFGEMPPGERELLHERAARLLKDAGAPVERVAAQLLASPAHGEEWVVDVLAEAAKAAASKGASDSVVTYLRRLLREPLAEDRRLEVTYDLGLAETDFEGAAAAEHLREVWEKASDPVTAAEAAAILARTLMFMGYGAEGVELLAEARSRLPAEHEELHRMLESLALISTVFTGIETVPPERREELRRTEAPDDVGGRMLSAAVGHEWAFTAGERERCVELAERAIADEELMAVDNGLLWVGATTTLVIAEMGDPDAAWANALARAHQRGSMFMALSVHLWQGWTLHRYGQLAEAEISVVQALEELRLWTAIDPLLDYPLGILGTIYADQGAFEAARDILSGFDRTEDRSDGASIRRKGMAELALAEGNAEEAIRLAREYAAKLSRESNPAWHPWRSILAQALGAAGRADEGLATIEEELELARHWGAPTPIGRALRIRGQLRREEGIEDLEQAVEILEASSGRLELARALAAHGAALRRARKPTEARTPLLAALELAESCGARPLESEVRTELRASGLRPRSAATSGAASLTPSERRVAELAAEGKTNKEIAQALYVTPKTVEVHLSNSYRKLDISSRRQLAGALAE
jgi:DNA-binding CsgD family transcriptional regulator